MATVEKIAFVVDKCVEKDDFVKTIKRINNETKRLKVANWKRGATRNYGG